MKAFTSNNSFFIPLSLRVYRGLAPLRLLICGGDGSVGWVLREIDKLQLKVRARLTVEVKSAASYSMNTHMYYIEGQ